MLYLAAIGLNMKIAFLLQTVHQELELVFSDPEQRIDRVRGLQNIVSSAALLSQLVSLPPIVHDGQPGNILLVHVVLNLLV